VAKRADSRYEPGRRSRNWLKLKTQGRQELVIAGYSKGQGRRADAFGALVLGVYENGVLRWAGNVGTGFDDAEIARLLARLKPLRRDDSPVRRGAEDAEGAQGRRRLGRARARREVRFAEWTHDGRLRAPVYQGCARTRRRRRCNASDRRSSRDQERQAGPQALEPGQAVLAGRGDHEGRPARVLPGRSRRRSCRT
jgi:bifunctional non-homologous end joining protein LigD